MDRNCRYLHAAKKAMTSRETLSALFDDLKHHGFRRKGLVWCRRSEQTLFSFELQKSNHGDRYFINLGVLFLRLQTGEDRPPHKCHFYGRFGDEATLSCLDFEADPAEGREATLTRFRDSALIKAASECSTEAGAAAFFAAGSLQGPLVLPVARRILHLEDDS